MSPPGSCPASWLNSDCCEECVRKLYCESLSCNTSRKQCNPVRLLQGNSSCHYSPTGHRKTSVNDLVPCVINIFLVFLQYLSMQDKLKNFILTRARSTYYKEILSLVSQTGGWHFRASITTTKQLKDFSLEEGNVLRQS
ncbi:hypothetical protein PAXRUDRAFT_147335 [Paxillus rubicundulus Ve08.2h10]|uniref:Uncharacterized protein n=1 Tax=Paxillus rubicundulus Ve08.2h10 TaxID=930991 RepID=A0A0D0E505_9AGAM|nr:hypothetical protein PAXRUDRAFT_147335 [Paxillus rubicundulus Ve08.2h10]